jgi:myo-inositol 2-dehydrogenase / D-chiro-inositol 1-dehydrogenase
MIRIAVLGAGRIGRIHARNVAASPRCHLTVVVDPVIAAAEALAGELGAAAVDDAGAALAQHDVDAVIIGTPTNTHIALMTDAARRRKAVLCEKPIDLDIARAEAAAQELEQLGARVMVAFNRRFDPSAQALKRMIEGGGIGEVYQVVITSRDPAPPPLNYIAHSGGIFRDMMIHDLDMARWLLGEEPLEVLAIASCLVDRAIGDAGDFDTAMVMLRTASGRQCHINNCRRSVYGYDQRLEVHGSEGMLLNDNLRASTLRRYAADATEMREPLLDFFLERYADAYRAELDAFVTAVEQGRPMPVTPQDGCRALRLADAALQSATAGQAVRIAP